MGMRLEKSRAKLFTCQSSARGVATSLLGEMLAVQRDGGAVQPTPQNLNFLPDLQQSLLKTPTPSSGPHRVHSSYGSLSITGDRTRAVSPCPGYSPKHCVFPSAGWDVWVLYHDLQFSYLFFFFSRNQTKLLVGDEKGRIFCWSVDG